MPDALITVNGNKRLVLEDLDFVAETTAGDWATWIGERLFAGDTHGPPSSASVSPSSTTKASTFSRSSRRK